MMRCAIIGWYGTETIGDRAILAALIKIISTLPEEIEFSIGSIYPFFTERTLLEEKTFIEKMCSKAVKLSIFDSRNHTKLKQTIKEVDCLFVGGGPLMDVSWMYMLEYALMEAKKYKKVTGLLGCGMGPLYKKSYIHSARNIISHSDIIIFRDNISKNIAEKIGCKKKKEISVLVDPAVFSAQFFLKEYKNKDRKKDYLAVNLRDFPLEYLKNRNDITFIEIKQKLKDFCLKILEKGYYIKFIPMHYFGIGGDDREYLNRMAFELNSENITVQNMPLTLEETMQNYADAKYCIGMRFHAILLQTILNGNNYILDYTEPKKGKTSGFLEIVEGQKFYKERYINLQSNVKSEIQFNSDKFCVNIDLLNKYEKTYREILLQKLR